MFDPVGDLNWTWRTLRENAGVLSAMGLTGANNLTIAKRIIKTSNYDGLAEGERRLCIFIIPSRPRVDSIRVPEMLQIDCHVPFREALKAYEIIAAVQKALHGRLVNGKTFKYAGMLGELATAPGYFCVGIRYKYHGSV